jgi:hypothetical protein
LLNTSESIKDLEVPEGRKLLHDFFHERRLRHLLELRTLLDCWRLCRKGTEIQFGDGRRVQFDTYLGAKLGTRVFFEEIVSKYYYNFNLGLVYIGAVIMLATVGLYLLGFSFWYPLAGFAVEAFFMLALAVITAYSPSDDGPNTSQSNALSETLLTSINNTVREMTNAVSDLFRLISQSDIRQDVLLTRLTDHLSKLNADNFRQYSETLEHTNAIIGEFVVSVQDMNRSIVAERTQFFQGVDRMLAGMASPATPLQSDRTPDAADRPSPFMSKV